MKSLYFIIFLCSSIWCYDHNTCISKISCSDCIQTIGCVWCSKPSEREGDSTIRCANKNNGSEAWCPKEFIVDVTSYYRTTLGEGNSDSLQIAPQNIKIGLKPGEKTKINLKYQRAIDFPTDLYYLMDLSASMIDDRDMVSTLGTVLVDTMQNLTNNLRLGFGSFVDKPTLPFVNTLSKLATNKCILPGSMAPCAPAYSFKNHVPLTDKLDFFSDEVKNAAISGNIDLPEGGFDALMQILVCTEQIGWREKARKIVIFSSDADFHISGDGKLAGIVTPNDELCHLDEQGLYTNSLQTDYPSISQLDVKTRDNNINVIFAVTNAHQPTYKLLSSHIYGSTYGVLSKDSSNIVELLKDEYNKIVESIALTDDASEYVKINYYTMCLGNVLQKTNECGGLKGRPVIEFVLEVELLKCPENRSQWNQLIHVRPGSLNENATIELEALCKCPCEEEKNIEVDSKNCNSKGNLKCGICSCNEGRYGRSCECDGNHIGDGPEDDSHCRPDNATKELCSNRGMCKCGKCDCIKRSNLEENVYGQYCECDNFSCQRHKGLVCSGHERGYCECGICLCLSGWSGPGCECRDSDETCKAPESYQICSGNGVCECGVCKCNTTKKYQYTGQYCEECPHCVSRKCNELKPCVECQIHKSDKYDENKCKELCRNVVLEVIKTKDLARNDEEYDLCKVAEKNGCHIEFEYTINDKDINVRALHELKCAEEIDTGMVIFSAICTTVLAGLLIIAIWKIVTTYHDKREYEQFEKERNSPEFSNGDNPLYRPSVSTFSNPVYGMQ